MTFKDWTFRLRASAEKPTRLLVLIHGWMGDEDSMWTLVRRISSAYTVLAPRGIFFVPEGGYSWRKIKPGTWGMAAMEDFRPAAEALRVFIDDWSATVGMDVNQFDLMGFSQGAAVTFTLALLHPERVQRLVALSGFIPQNAETILSPGRLSEKKIFISHGLQDDLIPVQQARRSLLLLKAAGAEVSYCESDTGHKVSKQCQKEMEMFLEEF
jgi:phospholipase/carboxylesterase